MRPDEAMRTLAVARQYDKRVLAGNDDERITEATEWATTLPVHMTQDQAFTAVRAHYSGGNSQQRLAPFHFIDWMHQHASNQPKIHNPQVLDNKDGTWSAWCPCGDLDQTELPTRIEADTAINQHGHLRAIK